MSVLIRALSLLSVVLFAEHALACGFCTDNAIRASAWWTAAVPLVALVFIGDAIVSFSWHKRVFGRRRFAVLSTLAALFFAIAGGVTAGGSAMLTVIVLVLSLGFFASISTVRLAGHSRRGAAIRAGLLISASFAALLPSLPPRDAAALLTEVEKYPTHREDLSWAGERLLEQPGEALPVVEERLRVPHEQDRVAFRLLLLHRALDGPRAVRDKQCALTPAVLPYAEAAGLCAP